ncbi:MAG TPA: PASTA domain-containing protein, partial [Planctomycetes bacterium]|nr:PASTA domain-containing protein [Planctomycetota bacterium]
VGYVPGTSRMYVVNQVPASGAKAQRGSTVNLTLGGLKTEPQPRPGPIVTPPAPEPKPEPKPAPKPEPRPTPPSRLTVQVPLVTGKPVAEACALVEQAGLKHSVRETTARGVPAGTVLSQDPAAGSKVAVGSTVTLVAVEAEKGRPQPVALVQVPNLVGKTEPAAVAALRTAGLTTGDIEYVEVPGRGRGTGRVIRQKPEAGQHVRRGAKVDMSIEVEVHVQPAPQTPPGQLRPEPIQVPQPQPVQPQPQPDVRAPGRPAVPLGQVRPEPAAPQPAPQPESKPEKEAKPAPKKEAMTAVPNMVGKSLKDARKMLTDVKLNVGKIHFVSDKEGDKVVAQGVAPGTTTPLGTKIDLTVTIKE